MDVTRLKKFLIAATNYGYAVLGESEGRKKESDGSKTTTYSEGDFLIHDNWFGGEPFGGREIVFYKNKPYWMMVYYGSDSGQANGLITFLQNALKQPPEELPVRGPKSLVDGDFRYEANWQGNMQYFKGEEKIYYQDKEVYSAFFAGGFVDQRKDQI